MDQRVGPRLLVSTILVAVCLHATSALEAVAQAPPVVRSSAVGWTEDMRWTMREDFRIGTVYGDGPTVFGGSQLSIAFNAEGEILVLDHQAREVRVFDRTGRYLHSFAGEGRGPGELRVPTGLIVDDQGRVWIPEAFDGRYTVFSRDGDLVRTVPRGLRGYNRLRQLRFEDGGHFIDHASAGVGAGFYRVDTLGVAVDTFPPLPYHPLPRSLTGPFTGRRESPISKAVWFGLVRLAWTLAPDHTLWFGYSDSMRLVQRTLDGDTLRVIEASHRTPSFTRAESEVARAAEAELGERSVFTPQLWREVHVLDDGHILVQVAGEFYEGSTELDVFDPSGRLLGTIALPFRMPNRAVPALAGDRFAVVHVDDLGVQYVVVGTIQR